MIVSKQVSGEQIMMRRFVLERHFDESGLSGTGFVAEGVQFSDGTVVLRWRGGSPSTVVQDHGIRAVEKIHGHGGTTSIVWIDEDTSPGESPA